MGSSSKIEWTDASWNPIRARNTATGKVGWHCEHATTGCVNCYAEGFNLRLGTGLPFKPGHRKDIELFLDERMLTEPLRWKRPRMVFVCSMTDLFAEFVPDAWIDRMFAVMALCPQHTFQVLTKRSARMREYVNTPDRKRTVGNEPVLDISDMMAREAGTCKARPSLDDFSACFAGHGPFRNVWLGVSAERQQEANERIPDLLATPAAVRFVSAEPLLGPIDFTSMARKTGEGLLRPLDGRFRTLDWIITGGESGPSARPMHPDWARTIRDQCIAAGVPFFFKQWGAWWPDSQRTGVPSSNEGHGIRVGKAAAGRLLDGREWNEMPRLAPRAGDHIFHRPTGETWIVAYVTGDRLCGCGWPEGEALLSDCQIVKRCTDGEHLSLLGRLALLDGRRGEMARNQLLALSAPEMAP